jgi:hypothetical protein
MAKPIRNGAINHLLGTIGVRKKHMRSSALVEDGSFSRYGARYTQYTHHVVCNLSPNATSEAIHRIDDETTGAIAQRIKARRDKKHSLEHCSVGP